LKKLSYANLTIPQYFFFFFGLSMELFT